MVKITDISATHIKSGLFSGIGAIQITMAGCNLQCDGFGQSNPSDPKTYILPYQTVDVSGIKSIRDFPDVQKGCVSSHSWASRFKHLVKEWDATHIATDVMALLPNRSWFNQVSGNFFDLVFTGGEPMLQQKGMIDIMTELDFMLYDPVLPMRVQIETNGTKKLDPEFKKFLGELRAQGVGVYFNIAPKLFHSSGETPEYSWFPDVIREYCKTGSSASVTIVAHDSTMFWKELEDNVLQLQEMGIVVDIFVTPHHSATNTADIRTKAFNLGYHFLEKQ